MMMKTTTLIYTSITAPAASAGRICISGAGTGSDTNVADVASFNMAATAAITPAIAFLCPSQQVTMSMEHIRVPLIRLQ